MTVPFTVQRTVSPTSITSPKSVLILGAGVSEPFGMPLGAQLVDGIADQIEYETTYAVTDKGYGREFNTQTVIEWGYGESWHRYPIHGTLVRSLLSVRDSANHDALFRAHEELQSLNRLLRNQTAETIDAFIAENPGAAKVAKLALAAIMLRNTYIPAQNRRPLTPRVFDSRILDCGHRPNNLPKKERNWIHLLVNIIRHGVDEGTVTLSNKVSIVTFNYDTILEHVFETQFRNRESPLEHYTNYVDIFHVHGQFGSIEANCTDPGVTAMAWAEGICVVGEKNEIPESVVRARASAKHLIAEAKSVFAIGFSFAGPNCRLLGLHENRSIGEPPTLVYANYDGNRGLMESARRYFIGDNQEHAGDLNRPLGVSDFIKAGFLGEPPG